MEFESKLNSAKVGGNKSDKKLSEMENVMKFYKSQDKIVEFYNDYFKMVLKAA